MTTPLKLVTLRQPFEALTQIFNTNTPNIDTSDSITSLMSGQFADHYTNPQADLWHYAGALIMYTCIAMGVIYLIYFYLKKQPQTLAKLREMSGHPDAFAHASLEQPLQNETPKPAPVSPISKKPLNHLIGLAALFQKETPKANVPETPLEKPEPIEALIEERETQSSPTLSQRIELVEATPVAQSADGSEMGIAIINIDGQDMVFRYSSDGLTLIKSGLVNHINTPNTQTDSTAFRLSQQLTQNKASKKRINSLKLSPLPKGSLLWKTSSTI